MNREEAKFILGAWRPAGQDATDPAFAGARQWAAGDPELGTWFAQAEAFDALLGEKLRSVQPPAGLRDRILAGARVSERRPWYRRVNTFALAAAVAILGLVSALWLPLQKGGPGERMPAFAMNFISHGFDLPQKSPDVSALKTWLASRHAPLPASIPANLAQLEGLGCRTVQFEGRQVSLICFHDGKQEYHLFVANREDFPQLAALDQPKMQSRDGWASAAWTDPGHLYVLVSSAGEDKIRRML